MITRCQTVTDTHALKHTLCRAGHFVTVQNLRSQEEQIEVAAANVSGLK